jgi:preprotein translocase subunit SecG
MTNVLLVIHVLAAIAIVVLVLMQQGRGADMGAAFGGGSQTLFGARGSANFLTRVTGLLAAIFFFTSISLAFLYGRATEPKSVTEQQVEQPAPPATEGDIPAVPQSEPAAQQGEVPSPPPAAGGSEKSDEAPGGQGSSSQAQ